ncbi:hypothetical protein M0R45_036756 [Rubus argutus]|uniref:Uncharacterized protein n=1 Tax=Rubus argutus TaxID=59490 RepID=A0AAW1W261_RUBAR
MVQRKVQKKLGIQADPNVIFEKRLISMKPSSQFLDGKNRGGADLKKKMKKSRSTKLSDIESLRSSSSSLPLRKSISQPGKPPTLKVQNLVAAAAVPQKQALTKITDGSAPNYMKSTSCSDARKEQSQKATCSSTLKDSKFPNYLMISPGGTEAEGTSVMKTQKTVKLQVLSPRKAKPSNEGMKETAKKEVGMDFFVEIYATSKEEDAQTIVKDIPEEQNEDVADEDYQPLLDHEEPVMRSCSSESAPMEFQALKWIMSISNQLTWSGRKSDAIVSDCNDIIHDYYEVLQKLFEEKTPAFEFQLKNDDGMKQSFGFQESERLSYDQFSYTEDSFEEDSELSETDTEISSSSTEEPIEDLAATGEEIQDDGTTAMTSNQISNAAHDISKTYEAETDEESEIQISDSAHTIATGDEDANKVGDNEDTAEEGNSGQDIVGESTFVETKDNLSDGEYKNNANAENHSISENEQSEIKEHKISSSTECEDHSGLKLKHIGLAENSIRDTDKMEVENFSEPDAAETFLLKANNSTSPGLKRNFPIKKAIPTKKC